MDKMYCVISHTHWDREWYMPFENFRVKLVNLVDNLLDILDHDDVFRFHLDAQTIVLEDYLEIKPENKEKLEEYIRQGRILVGPWYVQNDFTLTSGEATVRNLLIGSDMAEKFGKCTMVGYAPDQFGLISQLPQILTRFGVDTCLFARGYSFNKPMDAELYWKSQDGSSVLAVYMPYWYNNAQRFSADIDRAMKMMEIIKHHLDRTSTTGYYLLMNGVDHLEAQEDLTGILAEINNRLPEGEQIIQDTMPEYMERLKSQVKNVKEYTGEMRNGGEYSLLAGTLSSRVYLKQWNTRCQSLIENRLEPLYSFIDAHGAREYPAGFMRYLWKLLIQNHPHDSICGCSVDRVHEHMVDRFQRFDETAQDLLERGMEFISSYTSREGLTDQQYLITVFNTSQRKRSGAIEVTVEFPEEEKVEDFLIQDEEGNSIPYVIMQKRNKVKGLTSPINLPGVVNVTAFRIKMWAANVDGLSYQNYVVTPGKAGWTPAVEWENPDGIMENQYLKVKIHPNGTIDLTEKESGKVYHNLLKIEDREDVGDSYVYRCDQKSEPIYSTDQCQDAKIEKMEENVLNTIYSISYSMSLPREYGFAGKKRSEEQVEVPVKIQLSLSKDSRQLEIAIQIENRVKDHRMRVLFPTKISSHISLAGAPFDVIARDKDLIAKGIQTVPLQPNTNYISVHEGNQGITIFNEGLYEYENYLDPENTIAVTLLRGNGFISSDGSSMPVEEKWLVPGNQCLGIHTLKLAVYPYQGDFIHSQSAQRAVEFINPLFSCCHPVDTRKFAGGRPFVQDSEVTEIFFRNKKYPDLEMPLKNQFIAIDNEKVVLSAVKRKEKGDAAIIRLFSIADEDIHFNMKLFKQPKEAYVVNMKEERIQPAAVENGNISGIFMHQKEILTMELVW